MKKQLLTKLYVSLIILFPFFGNATIKDSLQIVTPMTGIVGGYTLTYYQQLYAPAKAKYFISTDPTKGGWMENKEVNLPMDTIGTFISDTLLQTHYQIPVQPNGDPKTVYVMVTVTRKGTNGFDSVVWQSNVGFVLPLAKPARPSISLAGLTYRKNGMGFVNLLISTNSDAVLDVYSVYDTTVLAFVRTSWNIRAGKLIPFTDSLFYVGPDKVYYRYRINNGAIPNSIGMTSWILIGDSIGTPPPPPPPPPPADTNTVHILDGHAVVTSSTVTTSCAVAVDGTVSVPAGKKATISIEYYLDSVTTKVENFRTFYNQTGTHTFPEVFGNLPCEGINLVARVKAVIVGDPTKQAVRSMLFDLKQIHAPVQPTTGFGDVVPKNIRLYPNPCQSTLYLPSSVPYIIIDRLGQTVKTGTDLTVDVSELPTGVYFLQTENGSGKFLKN